MFSKTVTEQELLRVSYVRTGTAASAPYGAVLGKRSRTWPVGLLPAPVRSVPRGELLTPGVLLSTSALAATGSLRSCKDRFLTNSWTCRGKTKPPNPAIQPYHWGNGPKRDDMSSSLFLLPAHEVQKAISPLTKQYRRVCTHLWFKSTLLFFKATFKYKKKDGLPNLFFFQVKQGHRRMVYYRFTNTERIFQTEL